MNLEKLKTFANGFSQLPEAWSSGEYTYATDHAVCVRIPRVAEVPETTNPIAGRAERAFRVYANPKDGWEPLPELLPIEPCKACGGKAPKPCPECDGDGEVELGNDFNTYTCDCKSCDGSGVRQCQECKGAGFVDPQPRVRIQGALFDSRLLRPFQDERGCRIALSTVKTIAHIEFEGGEALVAGFVEAKL